MERLTSTGTLFRFALRRDRLFLPLWLVGILALALLCAPLLTQVANSPQELAVFAETMKNPAMIALCGPLYAEPYTYGVMYTQYMTVWLLVLVGVMNIFLVSRHTREDEEDGKLEVMRSLPVGRLAILSSAWAMTVFANFLVGFFCAVGLATMGIESMTLGGCLLFGGLIFAAGMCLAAVAMIFSQLCTTSRGMMSGCFMILGIFYVVSAAGNISGNALAYASPFSIVFKASPFAGNHIWPIFALLAATLVLAVIAMQLNARRDLGAGLLPQRRGRAHAPASLSSPFGLALRLTRKSSITWLIAMFVLGASYGAIFGDFESFLGQNEMIQMIIQANGAGEEMLLSFMTYVTLIMSFATAIPVINCALKLRSEEKKGRLEAIYAHPVSRIGQFLPYIIIAIVLSVLVQMAMSLGMWVSISAVMDDPLSFSDVMLAGLFKVPGIWLFVGIGVFLTGFLPKLTSLVWLYFGASFFVVYIGRMMNIPDFFIRITAFGALPDYPIDDFQLLPIVAVKLAAFVLISIGVIMYQKDIVTISVERLRD